MSTYVSIGDVPTPDDAEFVDVAYDSFGVDPGVRLTVDDSTCFPTPAEARQIAAALIAAADMAEGHR